MKVCTSLFLCVLLSGAMLVVAQNRPLRLAEILPDTPRIDSVVSAPQRPSIAKPRVTSPAPTTITTQTVAPVAQSPASPNPAVKIEAEPTPTPAPTPEAPINHIEVRFAQTPIIEIELAQYVSSDTRTERGFRVFGKLSQPLISDDGEVILPAQTRVLLNALVTPGKRIGPAGSVVFSFEPIIVGGGTSVNNAGAMGDVESFGPTLQPLMQAARWKLFTKRQTLDYAAIQEEKGARILTIKPGDESLRGYRTSRPQQFYYENGTPLDLRWQTATSRFPLTGLAYDFGAATAGVIKLLISKRNLFLPSGTKLYFQLDVTLQLKRLTAEDSTIRLFE
jgi:hypothetical protein